jgi:hypothetical protein
MRASCAPASHRAAAAGAAAVPWRAQMRNRCTAVCHVSNFNASSVLSALAMPPPPSLRPA